ncbi:MAG: S8 family peptidase [Pseudonocardiaceae bacterium]
MADHKTRRSVLGVDPELVLVLELNGRLDPEYAERAGLSVLEIAEEKVLVTFASDPELTEFLRRCEEYSKGPRPGKEPGKERPAQFEELFDAVEHIRQLTVDDVLAPDLIAVLADIDGSTPLRLDVQCWCPEDRVQARQRHEDVHEAVRAAGGEVLDASLRDVVGLSLLRIVVAASRVRELAQVDRIRRIDVLPRPLLRHPEFRSATRESLPLVLDPASTAPILAVIDSGIVSAHPLLAPAVVGVEAIGPDLADGGDQHGHGTLVASLALYGSLESALAQRSPVRPAGRLLSLRVLDANSEFPDERLWEEQLLDAIVVAAQAGARVINLSLGDPRRPYRPPRPTPLAAAIDELAREFDLVVVISAGNYSPANYHPGPAALTDYPLQLLDDTEAGLLDPSTAGLALTVGALCPDDTHGVQPARDRVEVRPFGRPGNPSPLTRRGPGAMRMVKPEMSAPGGSLALDELRGAIVWNDPTLCVVGAGGEQPERLLAHGTGTSFAAPLVSHAALRVLGRYPGLSANAVRALVLASVEPLDLVVQGSGAAKDAAEQRRLTGYGRVSAERAEVSDEHRAVLLAEGLLAVDGVHLYTTPIPSTFFDSGGTRTLTVALAFDPKARPTRMDYMASRMMVRAYHGVSLEEVRDAYVDQLEVPASAQDDDSNRDTTPPALRRYEIDLQPSDRHRAQGAHQYGSRVLPQRLKSERGHDLILAVRNTNRWAGNGESQRYALVVVFERDADHRELYAELRAQLQALAEVEIEL